jgi:DNA-binding transcriptional regulator YiaG
MCKHVAAVLYGVGSRLDTQPELLFVLRGVEAQELITAEMALPDATGQAASDTLADDQLSAIFGIDLDTETGVSPAPATPAPQSPRATRRIAAPRTRQPVRATQDRKTTPARRPAGRSAQAGSTGAPQGPSPQSTATTRRAAAPEAASLPPRMRPTGKSVARLRRQQGLSVAQFAARLGVSATTVYRWELTPGPLNLHTRLLHALAALQRQTKKGGGS